eukprot:3132014-Amphidinium_carterae.1
MTTRERDPHGWQQNCSKRHTWRKPASLRQALSAERPNPNLRACAEVTFGQENRIRVTSSSHSCTEEQYVQELSDRAGVGTWGKPAETQAYEQVIHRKGSRCIDTSNRNAMQHMEPDPLTLHTGGQA